MAKLSRKKGVTSQIFHVSIKDSASTTGAGKTGLAYNTAGLLCKYIGAGGTLSASITLEDITTLGTYQAPTSNAHMRFKEISATDPSKGLYELHVHNDWMNLTGGNLIVMLAGASGMADCQLEIDLQADVNIVSINGDQQSAIDLKDFADTGYNPVTHKVVEVVLTNTCTTNTDMRGTDNAALASTLATVATYIDTEVQAILDIVAHATYGNAALNTDLDTLLARLTAIRAGLLDNLDAAVSSRQASGNVTVGGYAAGQTPADSVLSTPANKLATDATGKVTAGIVSDKSGYSLAADQAVNATKINGSAAAAAQLALSAATIVNGAAVAGTLSTTEMTTNLTLPSNDHFKGRVIIWTSGALLDQATDITGGVAATGKLIYTATTVAPSIGDTFIIV